MLLSQGNRLGYRSPNLSPCESSNFKPQSSIPGGLLNPPEPRQVSKGNIPRKTGRSCCCWGSVERARTVFPKECLLGPLSPRPQWKPWWPPRASAAPAATAPTRAPSPATARRPPTTPSPLRKIPLGKRRQRRRLRRKRLRLMSLARVGGDVISYTSYLVISERDWQAWPLWFCSRGPQALPGDPTFSACDCLWK